MDKIQVSLSTQSYNTIVHALQELPWRLAQPVFQELDPQVRAAIAKEKELAKESPKEA